MPVAPFGLLTVALAWLRCPLWLFIGATWFGGTVMLSFETSIGAGLGHALSHGQRLSVDLFFDPGVIGPLGALALLSLVPLLIDLVRTKRHAAAEGAQEKPHSH